MKNNEILKNNNKRIIISVIVIVLVLVSIVLYGNLTVKHLTLGFNFSDSIQLSNYKIKSLWSNVDDSNYKLAIKGKEIENKYKKIEEKVNIK